MSRQPLAVISGRDLQPHQIAPHPSFSLSLRPSLSLSHSLSPLKYQPHLTTSDVYFRPNRVKPMSNTDVASFRSAAATSREPWRPDNDGDDKQDDNNAAVGQTARLESGSRPNRPLHSPSPQRLVSRCRSGQRPGAGEEITPPPGRRRSGIVCR